MLVTYFGLGFMKKLFLTIAIGMILASGSVSAQLWSGNDFTETCTQEPDDYTASICSSFIIGIAQAGVSNRVLCLPENATIGQTLAIGRNYIKDHPEKRHIAASELIVASLIEAFPCSPE